ncbi:MAG: hypothetical protein IT372_36250 [Polyangiaceae bacterium]|nr:hypothetical protein [Polyangiaceae bacterium]
MRLPRLLVLVLPLSAPLLGCASDDETTPDPQQDAGDGKVYPEPSGVHTTETAACDALIAAYEARYSSLGCTVGTMRTCPNFIRAQVGGTQCLEYDQGTVDGCIAYYNEQTTCDALAAAANACVVTAYPGTEPNGCPAP